jgi:TRAP-type mannitol/chloroaromatic compound transport system permease small subunit
LTDTIPNSLLVPKLLRIFAWSTVSLTMLFLVNNYLIFWRGWPGLWKFFAHHQLFSIPPLRNPLSSDSLVLGSIQLCVLISIIILVLIFVFKTPNQKLIDDSNILTRFAAYLTRACFWAVLLVGFVDIIISFMRVEGFLNSLFGYAIAIDFGRPVFRGTYVHYPLIILSFIIAIFVRGLGFTWLALLVVIAEFQIVISRFVYSYEQAFMGDLVRMWYAALFLFASSYALITEGHVRVDVLYSRFKAKTKALSNAIGCIILGAPLCWVILSTGMWGRGSSLNSPLLSFEIYQQGYGLYVKYLMVAFLIVFAVSMLVQFMGYFLYNAAELIKGQMNSDQNLQNNH